MKASNQRIITYSAFFIYCVWVVASVIQHEPSADEYHVWRMVRDMSLSELWAAMSSEGHFILWHILQWPFVKWLGMDYHCLYCVSVPLMISAAWLLLFKLDFSIIGKLLILFSGPFCYNFPVIARCYALIPPILLGIAILYQKKKKPFLYCLLLGLMANTHAYMEGFVAIMWCLFVYNEVYVLHKTDKQKARKNLYASIITIVLVVFAFAQVVGGLLMVEKGINPPGEGKNTPEQWMSIFYSGYRVHIFNSLHNHIRIIPKLDLLVTLLAWLIVAVTSFEYIKKANYRKWQMLLILFVGIAWQIVFACNIYGMNWQRIYLPSFVLMFVMWVIFSKKLAMLANVILLSLWLLTTSSQRVVLKDLYTKQNSDVEMAAEYDALMIHDAPCYTDHLVGVNDLMQHKFEFIRFDVEDTLSTEKALSVFLEQTRNCYLLISGPIKTHENTYSIDTLVSSNIAWADHLYYVSKK